MLRVHRPRRRTVGLVLTLLVALAAAGWLWYTQPHPLLPEAGASLASAPGVAFSAVDGRLEWGPADGAYDIGLVVYPVPTPTWRPSTCAPTPSTESGTTRCSPVSCSLRNEQPYFVAVS